MDFPAALRLLGYRSMRDLSALQRGSPSSSERASGSLVVGSEVVALSGTATEEVG